MHGGARLLFAPVQILLRRLSALRPSRPRRVVLKQGGLPVHGFEGPVIFDSVGAGGNANRVSPCLVCRKDVALLEIRVASKALGQAEGAAEELDPPGQNHRAKDAEIDATRLLVRPTYCGLHLCQWRRE